MFYSGYYLFEDDTTLSSQELQIAQKMRKKAYLGSRMHFFRELWQKSGYKFRFRIKYVNTMDFIDPKSLVGDIHNHVRHLSANKDLLVYYGNLASYVLFVDGTNVPFARSVFFDSEHVRREGKMAEQRVGDLLPFEYWP